MAAISPNIPKLVTYVLYRFGEDVRSQGKEKLTGCQLLVATFRYEFEVSDTSSMPLTCRKLSQFTVVLQLMPWNAILLWTVFVVCHLSVDNSLPSSSGL